ncbi:MULTISPECIES: RimK family alpha-L-glutamate ligase [unclassified Undibacterium]|uniref:RimK family alpha-L-glutamate ligase n=1 Tax=unclassified Undibacterium TaxID=2630295 RepID=UPI002AC91DBD|nr:MULTISPECIES: RimK family alpha-L-glutamate ligase [unclassified Undibacterium]MEB0137578.1 RimK family alpha-L-glutamate ligase [Undibacterium sp. CCC2.1]MEB0170579.1 RimK family alpha-L-glutamate ligase [Undibacterium sp. CCC1.1]MEB0174520.1 RimK family alpha-L-glutamate ligase [Undibacterium sp. CCC3.4]MEB0213683.1 RimK family alpha-L-glutamate ligase [Undibacterium sp. 5I2]WPX43848.1 RimK family alpha-L-glutamate ligase [Undibacterium sp. CCC3.4]
MQEQNQPASMPSAASAAWVPSLTSLALAAIAPAAALNRLTMPQLLQEIEAVTDETDPGNLYMRWFYLLSVLGQMSHALEMQAKALSYRQLFRIADPAKLAVRLLVWMGPGDNLDNLPVDFLVQDSDIRVDLVFVSATEELPSPLPEHDICIVALGESEKNNRLLDRIEQMLQAWPRPCLNHPAAVRRCARDRAAALLQDISGLHMPATVRWQRNAPAPARFPLTVRPLDTHAGLGLRKIDDLPAWQAYLLEYHACAQFYVAEYVDYRSADGCFRKYRIALIEGVPYLCHLAIGEYWLLHYQSADMAHNPAGRAEEQQVMERFDDDFGQRHSQALRSIAERIGLDYLILDCGETQSGALLVFEVDNGAWIHDCDAPAVFPYKAAIMAKAFAAFRRMLLRRSGL